MPGARAALCLAVQPFGALSLRSAVPFAIEGALGFYIRGNGNTAPAALGGLEMQVGGGGLRLPCRCPLPFLSRSLHPPQPCLPLPPTSPLQFESSSPSRYAITRSITLAEALAAQAVAEGRPATDANAQLAGIAAGQWTAVKVPLAAFEGQPGFKADRWTLGSCLQRLEGCSSAAPALELCLDQASPGRRGAANAACRSACIWVISAASPLACHQWALPAHACCDPCPLPSRY